MIFKMAILMLIVVVLCVGIARDKQLKQRQIMAMRRRSKLYTNTENPEDLEEE